MWPSLSSSKLLSVLASLRELPQVLDCEQTLECLRIQFFHLRDSKTPTSALNVCLISSFSLILMELIGDMHSQR